MKSKLTKLTLSIILTLTIISLAVVLTLACKPLYYLDIHALHIPETTGCTISEIKAKYNAVIDYCLSFGNSTLDSSNTWLSAALWQAPPGSCGCDESIAMAI